MYKYLLLEYLRRVAKDLVRTFRLPAPKVIGELHKGDPIMHPREADGYCTVDGIIGVKLHDGKKYLRVEYVLDTLCHELAHLVHFKHNKKFYDLYKRILKKAKEVG